MSRIFKVFLFFLLIALNTLSFSSYYAIENIPLSASAATEESGREAALTDIISPVKANAPVGKADGYSAAAAEKVPARVTEAADKEPLEVVSADQTATIDTGEIDGGIVQIACQNADSAKLKVMIEKDAAKYTYDLKADGTYESFPLQLGNGIYKVSVLKNITGNRYSYLRTEKITLDLRNQDSVYLNPIQNINFEGADMVTDQAERLTKDASSDAEKVEMIYAYIVNNFHYDYRKANNMEKGYVPNNEETLSTKEGICYDFSSLFAAMVRSQGIPCKLIKGYAQNVKGYHAWNEVKINGSWRVIDTTADLQLGMADKMLKNAADFEKVYEY